MKTSLPLGPAALGWAIEALRLRKDVATTAGVGQSTVDRFLSGTERISDAKAEVVLQALVDSLFSAELLSALGIPEEHRRNFNGSFAEGVKIFLGTWNRTAASMNSSVVAVERADYRLLPWVRLVLIDVAVRYGALLRARRLPFPPDDFVEAAADGKAFAHVLEHARSEHEPALTHEELSKKANVGKNQPAAWLSGQALPQSETIRFSPPLSPMATRSPVPSSSSSSELRWLCQPSFEHLLTPSARTWQPATFVRSSASPST